MMGEKSNDKNEHPPKMPLGKLRTGHFVRGKEVAFTIMENPTQHVNDIIAMEMRDDDVLVAAFPKSGTHWLWEVAQMLINHTTSHEVRAKEHVMMEFVPVSTLDAQSSPRILNSHLNPFHLPDEMLAKKTKMLHVVRNPKDVLVSMYFHFKNFMDATWDQLVEETMAETKLISTQFSYLREMVEFQKQHPDHPVMLIYYEDMKKNPLQITKDLAKFLEVSATDEFCQQVVDACAFDKLKEADKKKSLPDHLAQRPGAKEAQMYRKGIIGDWRNHFTVAQNERFDAFIKEQAKDLPFHFTYE